MIYCVLPSPESYGGIKASCRLTDALAACGVRCVMVTPDESAPDWVNSSAPFASEEFMRSRASAADTVLFSAPHDLERLKRLPARLVFHPHHADTAIDPVIADPEITVLTGWPEVAAAVRQRAGREPIDVGSAVADVFFHAGVRKVAGTVAIAPRHASALAAACATCRPRLAPVPLEGCDERGAATILHRCEFFLAPEGDSRCSVERLEALAAGCVVIGEPETDFRSILGDWSSPAARMRLAEIRDRGRALAAAHRPACQQRRVAELLAGPLAFMRP
jgi:hypothetical protein